MTDVNWFNTTTRGKTSVRSWKSFFWFNTTTRGKTSVRSWQTFIGLTQQLEVRLLSDHESRPLVQHNNSSLDFRQIMTEVHWFNTTTEGKTSVRSWQTSIALTQQLEVRLGSDHDRPLLIQHNNSKANLAQYPDIFTHSVSTSTSMSILVLT